MPLTPDLNSLDAAWSGQPFCYVPATTSIGLAALDVAFAGQPFASGEGVPAVARVTQVVKEVLSAGTRARATQVVVEILSGIGHNAYVTQLVVEVLTASPRAAQRGTSWNVFQPDQYVDVFLTSGSLSSAADDLAVLNGANLCVIGSEVLQFRDVTHLTGQNYRLSYLLRGRFGTEWAMNQHHGGERFVLLNTSTIRRIVESTDDIDQLRFYKPVADGGTLSNTFTRSVSNTGVSLMPYAPYFVQGSRDGSSNLTLTWIRRTRLGGAWRDYVDVPLNETTESYEIDILDATGAVLRTLTATSATVTYSAANQTTDFGAPQSLIACIVYQLSDLVGRGYGTQANL